MRDNFDLIEELLDFSNPGTFYFIQILKRRKENPEMKTGTSVVDNFYLYGPEDLRKLKSKIMERCEKHNSRAYINLNRLDLEKIAMYTAKQIMDHIINRDFKSVKNAYATTCGSHHSENDKKWVVDIDEHLLKNKENIVQLIKKLHEEIANGDYRIIAEIPTRTGVHIICNPFNLQKFNSTIQEWTDEKVDVQKNSPTVLYVP